MEAVEEELADSHCGANKSDSARPPREAGKDRDEGETIQEETREERDGEGDDGRGETERVGVGGSTASTSAVVRSRPARSSRIRLYNDPAEVQKRELERHTVRISARLFWFWPLSIILAAGYVLPLCNETALTMHYVSTYPGQLNTSLPISARLETYDTIMESMWVYLCTFYAIKIVTFGVLVYLSHWWIFEDVHSSAYVLTSVDPPSIDVRRGAQGKEELRQDNSLFLTHLTYAIIFEQLLFVPYLAYILEKVSVSPGVAQTRTKGAVRKGGVSGPTRLFKFIMFFFSFAVVAADFEGDLAPFAIRCKQELLIYSEGLSYTEQDFTEVPIRGGELAEEPLFTVRAGITAEGKHIWPAEFSMGPIHSNATDELGKKFVIPWCHRVGSVPSRIPTNRHICHIDASSEHISTESIINRDFHMDCHTSMNLMDVSRSLDLKNKPVCMTRELHRFLKHGPVPGVQFAGTSRYVKLNGVRKPTAKDECLALLELYIPKNELSNAASWSSEHNTLHENVCDFGDYILQELHRDVQFQREDGELHMEEILLSNGKSFYRPREISTPLLDYSEKYSFSPILSYGDLWEQSAVSTTMKNYIPISPCRRMHDYVRKSFIAAESENRIRLV